jgi:hypothetical protein
MNPEVPIFNNLSPDCIEKYPYHRQLAINIKGGFSVWDVNVLDEIAAKI